MKHVYHRAERWNFKLKRALITSCLKAPAKYFTFQIEKGSGNSNMNMVETPQLH